MFNVRQIIYIASNLTKTQGSPWKGGQNGYESQNQWMTTAKWCFRNTRFFLSLFVASIIKFSLFFPNWPGKHYMDQVYFNTDTVLVLLSWDILPFADMSCKLANLMIALISLVCLTYLFYFVNLILNNGPYNFSDFYNLHSNIIILFFKCFNYYCIAYGWLLLIYLLTIKFTCTDYSIVFFCLLHWCFCIEHSLYYHLYSIIFCVGGSVCATCITSAPC